MAVELFDLPVPDEGDNGDELELFLIDRCATPEVEHELREFISLSCFTESEIADGIPERADRPFRMFYKQGTAADMRSNEWLIECDPNKQGMGLCIFPDEEKYASSHSLSAFFGRHGRFLAVENQKIVSILPIQPLSS